LSENESESASVNDLHLYHPSHHHVPSRLSPSREASPRGPHAEEAGPFDPPYHHLYPSLSQNLHHLAHPARLLAHLGPGLNPHANGPHHGQHQAQTVLLQRHPTHHLPFQVLLLLHSSSQSRSGLPQQRLSP
jgi:hypothetical protein